MLDPAFAHRFPHMLLAVLISAAWFVGGISAWYPVKNRVHARPMARRCLSIALGVLGVLIPIQLYVGDGTAVFMGQHQMPKLEAFEGNWKSDRRHRRPTPPYCGPLWKWSACRCFRCRCRWVLAAVCCPKGSEGASPRPAPY
ncbi:cytochrome ubiquinol oxidase subunit I [Streptomyces sp. NPDC003720]|uniref:cytochrome ubiquinol oxidase subunit I n=1 Tax=Streptomyces sp. NPDC003720 TaxID=3364684 RepID=UPI0036B9474B